MAAGAGPSKSPDPAPPTPGDDEASSSLWSDDLPPELAGLVLRRLSSLADRASFGAVCRLAAQQQSPTLPPALPWLCTFPARVFQSFPDGQAMMQNLIRSSQRFQGLQLCCGSSDNWLLFVDGSKNLLKNPLSGATIPLPATATNSLHRGDYVYAGYFSLVPCRKFIVCPDGLTVVAATSTPPLGRPLVAFYRPGMSSWSTNYAAVDYYPNYSCYKDIAFHRGNIYGVTTLGNLWVHEISEDGATGDKKTVVSDAKLVIDSGRFYDIAATEELFLVVSRDDVLLVKRDYTYGQTSASTALEVFEADLEKSRWSKVSSLGDQVLFVSMMFSKAVSASSQDGYLRGNRIYYAARTRPAGLPGEVKTCEMYDLSDDTCDPVITLGSRDDIFEAGWFFPHK